MHSSRLYGRRRSSSWPWLLLVALLLILDQWLKAWANTHLTSGDPAAPLIPGVLGLKLVYNTGAAWSLFSGSTLPLAIGRGLVGLGILAYLIARPQSRSYTLALALIATGAIGNTIDGLRFGRVTDMLESPALSAITQVVRAGGFPIFNIADSCIVGGTLLLVVLSFLPQRRKNL